MIRVLEVTSLWDHGLVAGGHVLRWWIYQFSWRVGDKVCRRRIIGGCAWRRLSTRFGHRRAGLGEEGNPAMFGCVTKVLNGQIRVQRSVDIIRHRLWPAPHTSVLPLCIIGFVYVRFVRGRERVVSSASRHILRSAVTSIRVFDVYAAVV